MRFTKHTWVSFGLLFGISALAYLPLIHKIGYINDDWYLMYDVRVHGPQFFHAIFSSDRPGRAFLMIPLYSLFGLNPLPYHILAYFFRFLSGVCLLWVLRIVWPNQKNFAFTAALLFTIFPGFLSQTNAIDYQSHIVALFLAILSIAISLKAIMVSDRIQRLSLIALSTITGWAYLSQMEYYIGIEVFRLACIAVVVSRSSGLKPRRQVGNAVRKSLPFFVIPVGFLLWRILLFQTERKATDIGNQLGQLFSTPLTGLWWMTYLLQDVFNTLLASWILPFSSLVFSMRLQNQIMGFGLAALAVLLLVAGSYWVKGKGFESESSPEPHTTREEIWVGIASLLGGLLPIILANRHIIFPDYSRYTLIASIGAVILWSVFFCQPVSRQFRIVGTSLLVAIGVLTHYGNSVKAANDTEDVRNFWWQVAWRAPQIEPGTTLSVIYPNASIQEDYFIWGAANHMYYPEPKIENDLQVELAGIVLTDYTVSRIIARRGDDSYIKRGGVLVINEYDNVLVISQATENSCVRILNGTYPDLSIYDDDRVKLVSKYSNLTSVLPDSAHPTPSALIFGEEPPHKWCYYYEKADLARQRGDWDEIIQLYKEAGNNDLRPNDQIEWMPFLQAFAYTGDKKMVNDISTRIKTNVFYTVQACRTLTEPTDHEDRLSPDMLSQINELFCH